MTEDFIMEEWQMLRDTYLTSFNLFYPFDVILLFLAAVFCLWKICTDIPEHWKWMIPLFLGYIGLCVYFLLQNSQVSVIVVTLLGFLSFCIWKIYRGIYSAPRKHVLSFGCCAVVFLYLLTGVHWDRNWVPPERTNLSVVSVDGKQVPLKHVWIFKIPPQVFSKLDLYPKDAKYLTGSKKHVLFTNANATCLVTKQYGEELSKMAQTEKFNKYYDLTKIPFGETCKLEADTYYCPTWWAMRYCGHACIINTKTQEIITDYSQDINQLPAILDAYANWDEKPLLNPNK